MKILGCTWMETVFEITHGSILRPLLYNIFLADLIFIISNIDIASYADDNTQYIATDNIDDLIKSLEEASTALLHCRQIHEIKQNRFFCGMFYSWFFVMFYRRTSKFEYSVLDWVLAIKSKHFRDFLEIFYFPKVLGLKSFGSSRGNSYTYFLVIII